MGINRARVLSSAAGGAQDHQEEVDEIEVKPQSAQDRRFAFVFIIPGDRGKLFDDLVKKMPLIKAY